MLPKGKFWHFFENVEREVSKLHQKAPTLTIITPAFNRKELLRNCFQSLMNQTCYNFEWIVVDDGSSDGTREEFPLLLKTNSLFPVEYVWKENGGKHTALNASHPYIHGKYILLLDSDDTLTENAVETVLNGWKEYETDPEIGMIVFLKQLTDGTIVAKGAKERVPVDVLNNERICNITNDCCEILRTELFLKYPFPVFKGERFLAETALWYRAGLNAKCIYINQPIYICEYLEDGLTKGGKELRIRNCHGGMYTSYLRMNPRCSMKERIKAGFLYVCYGHFAKIGFAEMVKRAKGCRIWTLLCGLPGTALYFYWKKKYMNGKE